MIDELLERKETGRLFPEKNPVVSASLSKEDKGATTYQPPSFGVQKEYELRLRVFVNFVANSAQYQDKERHAIRQLKYELYKDMIGDIYEALNVCDDIDTKKILARMLDRIGI